MTRATRREMLAGLAGAFTMASQAVEGKDTPIMRVGLVTYNLAKDWDLPTLLRVCQSAGLDGVEFRTTHAHGVEPTLGPDARQEVRSRCRDAGMRQVSLGTVCEFHSTDAAVVRANVETCRRFVGLARDIGARGVKVRPNGLPDGVEPKQTLEQIGRALAECGAAAADEGVEIWMEVHGGGTQVPANARAIMDACGHPAVGVTWNSNPTDVQNGSIRRSWTLLGRFVRCMHVTELWSGYPYRELFRLAERAGYSGHALCEVGFSLAPDAGLPFLRCYRALAEELCRP